MAMAKYATMVFMLMATAAEGQFRTRDYTDHGSGADAMKDAVEKEMGNVLTQNELKRAKDFIDKHVGDNQAVSISVGPITHTDFEKFPKTPDKEAYFVTVVKDVAKGAAKAAAVAITAKIILLSFGTAIPASPLIYHGLSSSVEQFPLHESNKPEFIEKLNLGNWMDKASTFVEGCGAWIGRVGRQWKECHTDHIDDGPLFKWPGLLDKFDVKEDIGFGSQSQTIYYSLPFFLFASVVLLAVLFARRRFFQKDIVDEDVNFISDEDHE